MRIPRLETTRLVLRSFSPDDAMEVERLAREREIAAGTLNIPHPYPEGAARQWIVTHPPNFEAGLSVNFCIERAADGALLGSVGMGLERSHERAELGYWIGRPYWGEGYATEAAAAVVAYGFEALGLNRIYAYHFHNNPASGRVLEKVGMTYEGCRRQHTLKWGEYLDNVAYGILRSEWKGA